MVVNDLQVVVSSSLAVGLGLAELRRLGGLVWDDFFDGFDGHPAAGFGSEGDVGPAAGLGDDFAQ